jgi:hypothetical protein
MARPYEIIARNATTGHPVAMALVHSLSVHKEAVAIGYLIGNDGKMGAIANCGEVTAFMGNDDACVLIDLAIVTQSDNITRIRGADAELPRPARGQVVLIEQF